MLAAVMALEVDEKKNGLLRRVSECKESLRLERIKNIDQDSEWCSIFQCPVAYHVVFHSELFVQDR